MAIQQTDEQLSSATDPARRPRGRTGALLGAFAVVMIVVAGIVVATQVLGDDQPSGTPSGSDSSATTEDDAEAADPGDEPTEADTSDDASLDEKWQRDAVKASAAGLPAMVPSMLPDGWSVVSGDFDKQAMTWNMNLTAPSGEVLLVQEQTDAEAIASDYLGADAAQAGVVDLSKWGTGEWQAWTGSRAGLTFELEDSTIALVGADQAVLEEIAKTLITAENGPVGGMDG
jgi:hypothetical protein